MIQLALPGFAMLMAEFVAFEILTLGSSFFSVTALAAQSALASISVITFQVPFSISIAASTRIANLVGASLSGAARTCIQVTMIIASFAGTLNMVWIMSMRHLIPKLFTSDVAVTKLMVDVLPLFAAFQLFDALTVNCNGILRGVGRQDIGGWINILCYYGVRIMSHLRTDRIYLTLGALGCDSSVLWHSIWTALGFIWALVGSSLRACPVIFITTFLTVSLF
jgi:MATE family multidrug resistance protein